MLNVDKPEIYTDFNSLTKLKQAAQQQSPEAIAEVAKQFESVFINMMLKSMRQASLAEGILDTQQSDFYRDMYDQQIAMHLSSRPGKTGIGIADFIIKQITPKSEDTQNTPLDHTLPVRSSFDRQSAVVMSSSKPLGDSGLSHLDQMLAELEAHQQAMSSKWQSLEDEWQSYKLEIDDNVTSKQDFIEQLWPYAKNAAGRLGVDPYLLIAQSALETGWGQAILKNAKGESSFNLFNIKADKSWQGSKTNQITVEIESGIAKKEIAGFRAYSNYQESFIDYVNFIQSNPRYSDASKKAGNAIQYIHELQEAGYATDPKYAEKIINIFKNQTSDIKRLVDGAS